MDDYQSFIRGKHAKTVASGFDLPVEYISEKAKEWQRKVVQWSLKRGRAALFEDTGLGKTFQQLLWAEQVSQEHIIGLVLEVVDFLETVAVTAFHLALTIVALEVNHF